MIPKKIYTLLSKLQDYSVAIYCGKTSRHYNAIIYKKSSKHASKITLKQLFESISLGIFNTILVVSFLRHSYSNILSLSILHFIIFSTKRVDHSNTRLASQLDRNPGSSPSWILVVSLDFLEGCFF